jgi:putative transposase
MLENFKSTNPKLGRVEGRELSIPLTCQVPVNERPYPIAMAFLPKVKEEIDRLLKLKIIRKSNSVYASPAFAVPKKEGKIRLVVDYRKLNDKTLKLGYPFPNIQYSLMDLKGSEKFSQIDLNMGYHQIPVKEEDVYKTAFVVPFGHYEFLRMPFGYSNAPREFQRVMTDIFSDLPFVKIFVDDILIFSRSEEEHYDHVLQVLQRCRDENLSINFEKSSFKKKEVNTLGTA